MTKSAAESSQGRTHRNDEVPHKNTRAGHPPGNDVTPSQGTTRPSEETAGRAIAPRRAVARPYVSLPVWKTARRQFEGLPDSQADSELIQGMPQSRILCGLSRTYSLL